MFLTPSSYWRAARASCEDARRCWSLRWKRRRHRPPPRPPHNPTQGRCLTPPLVSLSSGATSGKRQGRALTPSASPAVPAWWMIKKETMQPAVSTRLLRDGSSVRLCLRPRRLLRGRRGCKGALTRSTHGPTRQRFAPRAAISRRVRPRVSVREEWQRSPPLCDKAYGAILFRSDALPSYHRCLRCALARCPAVKGIRAAGHVTPRCV